MVDLQDLYAAHSAPQHLEQLYREARSDGEIAAFAAGIRRCFAEFPGNMLYAAWHYRLLHDTPQLQSERSRLNWKVALPLSLLAGLAFCALFTIFEAFAPIWALILALWAIVYLAFAGRIPARRAIVVGAALAGLGAYVVLLAARLQPGDQRRYMDLVFLHMPLAGWGGVALGLLRPRPARYDWLAFLRQSLAILGIAGICVLVEIIFTIITTEMFAALNIYIPTVYSQLIVVFASGFIPLLVAAGVHSLPSVLGARASGHGMSKLVAILLRALLFLTLIVLVIYACAIPFHFMEPFTNRRTLVASNAMLFGVIALLFGTAIIDEQGSRYRAFLRAVIVALAALAAIISLYMLWAIVYRAMSRALTINRVASVGWNIVNTGLLILLLYRQLRDGRQGWLESLRAVFGAGAPVYVAWALLLLLVLPALFIGR